jgi:hypothetical protein
MAIRLPISIHMTAATGVCMHPASDSRNRHSSVPFPDGRETQVDAAVGYSAPFLFSRRNSERASERNRNVPTFGFGEGRLLNVKQRILAGCPLVHTP